MLTDIRLVFSPSKSLKQTYQECLWVNQALVHLLQPRLTFLVGLVWTRDRTKIHICEGIEGNGPKVKGSDTITRIQLKINITYTLPLAYIHIGYIMSFNTGLKKKWSVTTHQQYFDQPCQPFSLSENTVAGPGLSWPPSRRLQSCSWCLAHAIICQKVQDQTPNFTKRVLKGKIIFRKSFFLLCFQSQFLFSWPSIAPMYTFQGVYDVGIR